MKNGDRWVVTATNSDGTMALRRASGSGEVVLPADYVAQHVELAYATTAYRSQGRTTDTAHAVVSPSTTREVLYVAATSGRESNRPLRRHHLRPRPRHRPRRRDLTTDRAETCSPACSPTRVRTFPRTRPSSRAQRQAEDFTVLAAEYETLARAAQEQRWGALLERSGLDPGQLERVRQSEAHGPLLAALRDAEARGLDVEGAFPKLVAVRSLDDAEDPAAILHGRVDRWVRAAGSKRRASTNLIAGLISPSGRRERSRHGPRPRRASRRDAAPGERARHPRRRASPRRG